ncbi:T9SS type A sorting domain-containing protein [candidate division WOR-3 bacterium]|nr:T9SS type A sorting domain-containing protein [candidate division WOR-3 bacterium]
MLQIRDIERVKKLGSNSVPLNGRLPAGEERVKDISMGVYFVKLTTKTESATQKIVVLKRDPVPGWWNR